MSEALNEIHAYFGKLNTTTTKKVSQWAYGQKLIVHDADLPSVFEAYYSNSRSRGEAKPQIGTDGEAPVPDEYFLSGADIYVFLMEHEGADDGRYRKIVHIPIDPCSQPSDVEPSPVQQNVIDQAIAALNTAVTQTGEDKAATAALAEAAAASSLVATEAAQSAQASATSASGSATTATNAANTASTKASEAATSAASAASAKTAAETAETNAQAAQTASESAQASAESAAQTATTKASEASTSATNASGSASAASASATSALESATQAAASATSASGSATAAAGSANTASTKASEASASATNAATAKTGAEAAQTAAETAQAEAEAARNETVTEAASIRGLMKDKADIIISNAEGAIATFEDGGNNMPMVSCVAKIEPVQSGSGDPSPQNIRPITGWTGAVVKQYAGNLLNEKKYNNSTTTVRIGTDGTAGTTFALKLKKGQYTLKVTANVNVQTYIRGYYPNTQTYTTQITIGTNGGTFTITDEEAYYNVWCYHTGSLAASDVLSWVLSPGTSVQDAEYVAPTTYNISWQAEAGTVYGGTLDVVSGVLTVNMAMVDLGELTFSATNTANIFYAGISDMRTGYSAKIVCEAYKRYSAYYTGMPDKSVANNSTYGYIYIKDTDYSDADTFMTSLSGIYLAYEIKNPTTVQLTPHEVSTLLGRNNVWADTGDVEIQYRADTKLYIDGKNTDFSKLIAPTEAAYTATRAYTSGSLLIVGNQLYKATTAIANGATLTVGTNITATTLAEVIAAL